MKKIMLVIATLLVCASSSKAQTGQAVADFIFTNSAVDVEGFRGMTHNRYIAAFTYAKDITISNDIANAGVLVTYDRCFTPHNSAEDQSDQLTGGFTLKTSVYPLRHWNPTSTFRLDIGAYEEAGTITSGQNNGKPVNILGMYADWTYNSLEIGILYQNRTEDDFYAGNYIGAHIGWRF